MFCNYEDCLCKVQIFKVYSRAAEKRSLLFCTLLKNAMHDVSHWIRNDSRVNSLPLCHNRIVHGLRRADRYIAGLCQAVLYTLAIYVSVLVAPWLAMIGTFRSSIWL